jgi:hypothetical protein
MVLPPNAIILFDGEKIGNVILSISLGNSELTKTPSSFKALKSSFAFLKYFI